MKLKVRIKEVYGRELIYPSCRLSILFARLLRRKTLTENDIQVIKQLGYEIEAIEETVIERRRVL